MRVEIAVVPPNPSFFFFSLLREREREIITMYNFQEVFAGRIIMFKPQTFIITSHIHTMHRARAIGEEWKNIKKILSLTFLIFLLFHFYVDMCFFLSSSFFWRNVEFIQ